MGRWYLRIREWFLDALFFLAIPGVMFGLVGYLLVAAAHARHPQPKVHWNRGPQDPEATH